MKYALLTLALAFGGVGCGAAEEPGSTDAGSDTTAADSGSDSSTEQDTGTDSGTDVDTETDTGGDTDTDTDTGSDTDTDTETVPEIADLSGLTLTGTPPADNLEAPEFEVTASDSTARTRADLVGQPTVMWFFPIAESWSVG